MDFVAISSNLHTTDVTEWGMTSIESILVSNVPRWGMLLSKKSLSGLFEVLNTVIARGLGIQPMTGSPFPAIARMKIELLRILWCSSALSTIEQLLKVTVESTGDDSKFTNVVLSHYPTEQVEVLTSQALALDCLAGLLRLIRIEVNGVDLNQLKQSLTDILMKDSSALLLGITSFVITDPTDGSLRDSATQCLIEIFRVCDIPPSVFSNNSKVKNLNDKFISALTSHPTQLKLVLLGTVVVRMPSIVSAVSEKSLIACIQKEPYSVHFASAFVESLDHEIEESKESIPLTGGAAVSITRTKSENSSRIDKFLESTLGSPEWIESNLFTDDLGTLSNFFAVLQDARVDLSWISGPDGRVSEPSLSHVVRLARLGEVDARAVDAVNEQLDKYRERRSFADALLALVQWAVAKGYSATFPLIRGAIIAAIGNLVKSDSLDETIREYPMVLLKLAETLGCIFDADIQKSGTPLVLEDKTAADSTSNMRTMEIVSSFISTVSGYAKSKSHRELFFASLRLFPHALMHASAEQSVLRDILAQLDSELAFADPSVLASIDALILKLPEGPTELLSDLVAWFERIKHVDDLRCLVSLFSLMATLVSRNGPSTETISSVWRLLASHPIVVSCSRAGSWNVRTGQYKLAHLVWMHALQLGVVVALHGPGTGLFIQAHREIMTERFTTAHTGDLATLEETCLLARIVDLTSSGSHPTITPLVPSFQFTSLITPKPPSVCPKSRSEKIAALCPPEEDVQSPAVVPSAFAQRVVWLAADIMASALRVGGPEDPTRFHALLDLAHFLAQYLRERRRCVMTLELTSTYVPLSVYLKGGEEDDFGEKKNTTEQTTTTSKTSLLHSLSASPISKPANPSGSLMDSLTPKNSPKRDTDGGSNKIISFSPPRVGDCPSRTGLSFVSPALVTVDDFTGKLVELLELSLIQAAQTAGSKENLLRPLLDLLYAIHNQGDRIPEEAAGFIKELIDNLKTTYNQFSKTNFAK
jgi:hypothetical protein